MPVASCQLMPLPDEGFSCCRCSWKRVLFRERHLLADIWTVHRRHIWTLSGHFTSCQNPLPLLLLSSLSLSVSCLWTAHLSFNLVLILLSFLTLNDWWSCCIVCGCFQVWANFTTTITTISATKQQLQSVLEAHHRAICMAACQYSIKNTERFSLSGLLWLGVFSVGILVFWSLRIAVFVY